jgi:hypothetical protein
MFGLMQQHSLLISSLIEFANRHHGKANALPPWLGMVTDT